MSGSSLPYDEEDIKSLQLEGEDYSNLETIKKFILEHPQPSVKSRNWEAFSRRYYKTDENERGVFDDFLKDLLPKMAQLEHPTSDIKGFDPYYLMKEYAIGIAARNGWMDIVRLFENSKDPDNRAYVARMYGDNHMVEDLFRMESIENDPKTLAQIFSSLKNLKVKAVDLIERNREKYANLLAKRNDKSDSFAAYHAEELGKTPVWVIDHDDPEGMNDAMARYNGALLSISQIIDRSTLASNKWSHKYGVE